MAPPAIRAMCRCQSCEEQDIECGKPNNRKICKPCEEAGRSLSECKVNKPWHYLIDVSSIMPTLVPEEISENTTRLVQRYWSSHIFLADLLIALVALKKDARSGGADFYYAIDRRDKSWSAAAVEWTRPSEGNCKALYLYAWLLPIFHIEQAQFSALNDRSFAMKVSSALETGARMFHTMLPFVERMNEDPEFSQFIQITRVRMTQAEIDSRVTVKNMYNVIHVHDEAEFGQLYPIIQGECKKLAGTASQILEGQRKPDKSQPDKKSDPRSIMLWTALRDLHDQFWKELKVSSGTGQQHALWWMLLANWAVSCYRRRDIWYFKDVGERLVGAVVDILKEKGLDHDELWRDAMAQPLKVPRDRR